jgi:hypothetical protein
VLLPELPRMQNLQSCVCCYQSFLECKTFNLVCVLLPELPRMQNLQALCVCVCVCVCLPYWCRIKNLCSKKDGCEWGKIWQLPADIQWHFVGHLQSNKAKVLVCEFATNSLFSIIFGSTCDQHTIRICNLSSFQGMQMSISRFVT